MRRQTHGAKTDRNLVTRRSRTARYHECPVPCSNVDCAVRKTYKSRCRENSDHHTMINPNDSIASSAKAARSAAGRWRYPALLAAQTAGAFVLLWNAVPLYRQVLADPAAHVVRNENLVWGLSSIALLQAGYWISYRIRPTLPRFVNPLLGHIILFFARLSFVFATSVFGFLFIMEKPGFHIPVSRYVITLLGLFALYCYMLELERLGRAFLGQKNP